MSIESLELCKKTDIKREAVENADRIMGIDRRHQRVAGVMDRLQVALCHVSCDAGEGEVMTHRDHSSRAATAATAARNVQPERPISIRSAADSAACVATAVKRA